jgi:hypothetical protein
MRGAILLIVQILISLVVAALVMPAVLVALPAARGAPWGPVAALGIAAAAFGLLWAAWRFRKS